MKVTETMINAACDEAPLLQRDYVARIVQSALDTETSSESHSPSWKALMVGTSAISAVVTFFFFIAAPVMSGTWLDPRVWSGEYVPGDTMASSMSNGAWMMNATANTSICIFIGVWMLLIGLVAVTKKFKNH